jgi:hypothetical protein
MLVDNNPVEVDLWTNSARANTSNTTVGSSDNGSDPDPF